MRFALFTRSLVSGIVVYAVVAACAASGQIASVIEDGGAAGAVADALVDGIASPVGVASAADPLPPDVATEKCDKVLTIGGTEWYFAVHEYPGRSPIDLTRVRILVPASVDGLSHIVWTPYVGDGRAAWMCGLKSAGPPPTYDVTFVLPK